MKRKSGGVSYDINGTHCYIDTEQSYYVISPINSETLSNIDIELLDDEDRAYFDRFLADNIFGDYQCG